MCHIKLFVVIATIAISANLSYAKPCQEVHRYRRTSDQRLAELETLVALAKMNKKLVTIPVGFGKVDPQKLGRRRRSISALRQLINDLSLSEEKTNHEISNEGFRKEEDGGEDFQSEDLLAPEANLFNDKFRILSYPNAPMRLPQ